MSESSFVDARLPTNRSMPAAAVIPVLHYADVAAATAWLCRAFGFAERLRIGAHRVQLAVGEGGAVVVAEGPAGVSAGHSVMVRIRDADSHHAAARAAGATILAEPATQPYGERQYSAVDLGGHVWTFSETIADVDPAAWGGVLTDA
jgi:uncharacterized glyoxalase superfamily protein PhnB